MLALGMLFSKIIGPEKFRRQTSFLQMLLVCLLLFFMGVNTGSLTGVLDKLGTIGSTALLCTLFAVLGTIVVSFFASLLFSKRKERPLSIDIAKRKEGSTLRLVYDILKEPLFFVGIVALGMTLRLTTNLFCWFQSSYVTILLMGMVFFVGMGMEQQQVGFKQIMAHKELVLLPLYTIGGSFLGSLFIPLCTGFTLKEALGMTSGFGWYSLSGVLISDLGYPLLGSISFLSNLLRETFSFFLIPLFGRMGKRYYYSAVCTAGATSMDVTLALLVSNFGSETIVSNIYHGVVMSLVVPLLIPLFFT